MRATRPQTNGYTERFKRIFAGRASPGDLAAFSSLRPHFALCFPGGWFHGAEVYDALILGAGLSGLQAARDLQDAGWHLLVLDKAKGVGGRAATRRWDDAPVDHGAQFFTVRSPEFRAQTDHWLAREVCFHWTDGFHQWDAEHGLRAPDFSEPGSRHPRYACRAGMSALCKDLAAPLRADPVRLETRVVRLHREQEAQGGSCWRVEMEDASSVSPPILARRVISTLPTPQTLALLADSGLTDESFDAEAIAKLRAVRYAPTLAVLLRGSAPKTPWQGIQLKDDTLGWISADTDKRPGGVPDAGGTQIFVLHGSAEFSAEWQDRDLETAADRMIARAGEIVGDWITRLPERQVHRWRFASVPEGVEGDACLRLSRDGDPPFYVAGDAFLGAKIEGAYRSGQEAARTILAE